MPAKRKLSDGRSDEDNKSSTKKPKRVEMDDTELMQALYDTIRNHKTEDGHLLCEAFVRAPKRRTDPEYYNLVSRPIDLIKIQHKLKSDEYRSLDAFVSDVETLVENAKIYYRPDTQEYQDACDLWELFLESKTVLLGEELAEYDHDTEEDDEEDDDEEEEPFTEEAEKGKEVLEARAEVTNPSPEISSIVIPGTGSTPTIKLKMASSPPAGEARDAAAKMESTSPVVEGGESGKKSHDDDSTPKETEPIRSLRERRYTYRDFLFPKVVISEKQDQVVKQTTTEKEMEVDDNKPSVSCEEDDTSYEELFAAVVTAKDGERCISEMFKLLPSKKKYPDYYDVIHDPIDLRTIAQKIQGNEYKCLDEMVQDLNQMIHNAKSFNETGSQIYRDAVTLKKIVTNKKHELDQLRNSQHPVRSERIRTRKANAGQRLSLIIAAMDSDSEKEDSSEVQAQGDMEDLDSGNEASAAESEDDSLWILYRTVKSQKNSLNQRISEPFLRLPSRRVYPDYYEEIKKPMSLLKIQKKLKSGQYTDLDHLAGDLDLVFENAKRYNMDESKLYKDAVRLQGVMNAKLKELKNETPVKMECESDSAQDTAVPSSSIQSENCNHSEVESKQNEDICNKSRSTSDKNLPASSSAGIEENCASCTSMDKPVIESSHSIDDESSLITTDSQLTSSTGTPPTTGDKSINTAGSVQTDVVMRDTEGGDDLMKKENSSNVQSSVGVDGSSIISTASNDTKAVVTCTTTSPQTNPGLAQASTSTFPQVKLTTQQLPLPGLQLGVHRPAVAQLPVGFTGLPVGQVGNIRLPFAHLQMPLGGPTLPLIVGQMPLIRGPLGLPAAVPLPIQVPILTPGHTVTPVISEASDKCTSSAVTDAAAETTKCSPVTVTSPNSLLMTTASLCTVDSINNLGSGTKNVNQAVVSEPRQVVVCPVNIETSAEHLRSIVTLTSSLPASICTVHVDEHASADKGITRISPSVTSSQSAASNGVSSANKVISNESETSHCSKSAGSPVSSSAPPPDAGNDDGVIKPHARDMSSYSTDVRLHMETCHTPAADNTVCNNQVSADCDHVASTPSSANLSAKTDSSHSPETVKHHVSKKSHNSGENSTSTTVDKAANKESITGIGCLSPRTSNSASNPDKNSKSQVQSSIQASHSSPVDAGFMEKLNQSSVSADTRKQMSSQSSVPISCQSPVLDGVATETSGPTHTAGSVTEQTQSDSLIICSEEVLSNMSTVNTHSLNLESSLSRPPDTHMGRSSVPVSSRSTPVNAKPGASQAAVMSRESPLRSSFPSRHLKGFPIGYINSRPQLRTPVQSLYQPLQASYGNSVQVVNPLQMTAGALRYPGLGGQQMLVNQAGQLINPGCLPMLSASYTHPTLPVSQAQYSVARNPVPLAGLQLPASQPMMHLPRGQCYQAAYRQPQSMVRYIPLGSPLTPAMHGLPAVSASRSVVSPAQYMMVSPQLPAGYPQMMYSPQVVSQAQQLASPLQLSASQLGMQVMPRMTSANTLGMPLILTQPPQPRMRFS